jgi:hypothetical protein
MSKAHPVTGRLIDPRVEALGKAMLAMCIARDDLAKALSDLAVNCDPINKVLLKASERANDLIDRAMQQRAAGKIGRRAA